MKELFDFAVQLAEQAGEITLKYFRSKQLSVETKPDRSPVTEADRATETFIRQEIEKRLPDHGILGEEFGEKESRSGLRWLIDPIDGTKSFIRGIPFYGTMLAVESEGESRIGVIRFPPLGDTIAALSGHGCFCNGEPCTVSKTDRLSKAALMLSSPEDVIEHWGDQALLGMVKESGLLRTWADCYGYFQVATGQADITLDAVVHIWDVGPFIPIIQEAGGTITDLNGEISLSVTNTIATNGILHDELLQLIRNS